MSEIEALEVSFRQKEIVNDFQKLLEKHMAELRNAEAEKTYEIRDFADALNIHPTHLSNTIHQVLNQSPCDLYENRLVELAKELLSTTTKSIGEIATQLCYDPSNFTKFFKLYTGITPKQFRKDLVKI